MKRRAASRNSFQVRFGQLVRDRRIALGLSQLDLARLAYGDEERASEVADVESGRYAPKADKIARFRHALNIPIELIEQLRDAPSWPRIVSPSSGLDRVVSGRDADVDAVRDKLDESSAVAIVPGLVLKGAPGVGKSTLGRYYAAAFREHYFGIWWLRAQSRQTLINDFYELSVALDLAAGDTDRETLAHMALAFLQSADDPWLLVFDNARLADAIRDWRPENGNIHFLVTSRSGNWPTARYGIHKTEVLQVEHATDLLLRESGRNDSRDAARILAINLDQLPLAIVVAGAWLRDRPSVTFEAYLQKIDDRIADKPVTLVDYPNSVYGAIVLSIRDISSNAETILRCISFFAPDRISPTLFYDFSEADLSEDRFESVPKSILKLVTSRPEVEAAFAELERNSLIEREGNSWRIHRTTQIVCRATLAGDQQSWMRYASSILSASYPSGGENNPQFAINWPKCEALNPHVEMLFHLLPKNTAGSELEHNFNQAALYYWKQEQRIIATQYALRVLRSRLARLPRNSRDVAEAYSNLAAYLAMQGKLNAAKELGSKAVQIAENNAKIPDADKAIWHGCFGYVLNECAVRSSDGSNWEAAIRLARESRRYHHVALRLHARCYGRISRQVGIHLRNIGKVLETLGREGAAFSVHKAALSIRRKALQPSDPDLGISLSDVGGHLLARGNLREAGQLLRQCLSIFEAAYPSNPSHGRRLDAARKLALWSIVGGELTETERLVADYNDDLDMAELVAEAKAISAPPKYRR